MKEGEKTLLRSLPGVGPRRERALEEAGISSLENLLLDMPIGYQDRRRIARVSQARPGEEAFFRLRLEALKTRRLRSRRRSVTEASFSDESGSIAVCWFNMAYMGDSLRKGETYDLYGKVRLVESPSGSRLEMAHPEIDIAGDPEGGRILPVYRRIAGLGSRLLRNLHARALDLYSAEEPLPRALLEEEGMLDRGAALRRCHSPPRTECINSLAERRTEGFRRLIFEELLGAQVLMAESREARRELPGVAIPVTGEDRRAVSDLLPFALTGAQESALNEVCADLAEGRPMYRLLQGDVGSGKTAVAMLALLMAAREGVQGAFMAPTEILARQQAEVLRPLARARGLQIAFLASSLSVADRRSALKEIASGRVQIAVGTHSLFQRDVVFARLGLVVIDEQHRFGVSQRASLLAKGKHPNVLVMSATPIPRSLALTVYGDLDLSVLDEFPHGARRVRTVVRDDSSREAMEAFLRREMDGGKQIIVVYPWVEAGDSDEQASAEKGYDRLRQGPFRSYRTALLHGRLDAGEKEITFDRLVGGDIQLLVATSLVEVGIDLPDATVMVVERAEQFGLSQLHQFRGRVGRRRERGLFILMKGPRCGPEAEKRLDLLVRTEDGFRIAEEDLRMRGPGDAGGVRQWGRGIGLFAHPIRDFDILMRARHWASRLAAGEVPMSRVERRALDAWKKGLAREFGSLHGIG